MVASRLVLLDNRDSFVWNLAQALAAFGICVEVVRSDRVTVDALATRRASALVLSPGPGRPEQAGVCVDAVRALSGHLPILGVCLGHQAIASAFGAAVRRSDPCHGRASAVHHRGAGLFRGLPSPFAGCRYHSLAVDDAALPPELAVDARTTDGVVMALRHRQHPTFGVQFHPESFRTECGTDLLRNFLEHIALRSRLPESGDRAVDVEGVTKTYVTRRALVGVDLHVGREEIVGLVGANGAGKTTLLRILVGLSRRDGGRARVLGGDPTRDSLLIRRNCCYLPGEAGLYGNLTGTEVLAFALAFYPHHDRDRAERLQRQFALPLDQRLHRYSAGMKQKLALLLTFAPNVDLYVLDEPDRNLDPTARWILRDCITELRDRGKSVLVSSHHLGELDAVAQRLVFLVDGRTITADRVEAARRQLHHVVRLRLTPGTPLPGGTVEVKAEIDGTLRVVTVDDPLAWVARLDATRVQSLEVGATRLDDLYRVLLGAAVSQ